jgi:hypothetical protein
MLFCACSQQEPKRTVWLIPVYGQSLALGEEAIRITDFDSLKIKYDSRIVTERLDNDYGYFSDSKLKTWFKRLIGYNHRQFELSVYGMAEYILQYEMKQGNDSLMLCIFPGGQGLTALAELGRASKAYSNFLQSIEEAYQKSKDKGWDIQVPALCWMHGESDIVWGWKGYKKLLSRFAQDFNEDVKRITGQKSDVVFVSYQTNCLTLSEGKYHPNAYNCPETEVPTAQMELIRDNALFMASGPTYPYSFVSERVHLDGFSQNVLGHLAALSILRLTNGEESNGVMPTRMKVSGDTVIVNFNVPSPPLVIDTVNVRKADHWGFSVISPSNTNILTRVILQHNSIKLVCSHAPTGCKIRYAVNGEVGKSGNQYGPRGNLRDSQGDHIVVVIQGKRVPLYNWCYQFDEILLNE